MTVKLTDTMIWQQVATTTPGQSAVSVDDQGLSDPTLAATWRCLDQREHFLSWDWLASYSPNLLEDVSGSTSRIGTDARGGQSILLGTAASWMTPYITVYTDFEETYLSTRQVVNTNNSVTQYDGYWQGMLALNTQFRFSDYLSLNAGFTGDWNGPYDGVNQGSGLGFTVGGGDEFTINAALNAPVIPNALALSLTYSNTFYSDRNSVYPNSPGSNNGSSGEVLNSFGLRVLYVFL